MYPAKSTDQSNKNSHAVVTAKCLRGHAFLGTHALTLLLPLLRCSLVGWFVHSLRSLWFLGKYKSDFREIWHRRSASLPNFIINLWEVKVKVQGQNRRTKNLVIARPWFNITTNTGNPTDIGHRSNFDMKYSLLSTKLKISLGIHPHYW